MSNVNYKRAQRLCKTHIMIGVRQEHLTNINTEFRLKELLKNANKSPLFGIKLPKIANKSSRFCLQRKLQEHLTNINTEFRLKELQKNANKSPLFGYKVTKKCKQVVTVSFTKKTTKHLTNIVTELSEGTKITVSFTKKTTNDTKTSYRI